MKRFFLLTMAASALGTGCANSAEKNPVVVVETSMGKVRIELFQDKAPITVKNFLAYVDDKFYDGLVFHRVIPDFMVQGGGFEPGMKEKKTKDQIKNEAGNGVANTRGTLAMARTSVPDSASSQFFVNLKDNAFLDRANSRDKVGYCVFGKVIEGMNVIDKIAGVSTGQRGPHGDVPTEDVTIKTARLEKAE